MECWGVGPFENQWALNWLASLERRELHPDQAVQAVLDCCGRVELEPALQAVCACTLAANTVQRVRHIPMPREAWRWLDDTGFDCSSLSRNAYRQALLKLAADSELDQRWRGTHEYANWRAVLVRIEQRFTPQPLLRFEHPDYAQRTEPFWYWRIRQPQIHRELLSGSYGVDRRAFERLSIELQCGIDSEVAAALLHEASQIVNRQLLLNGLGRLEDLAIDAGSLRFRTHRGMERHALRLLTACLRPLKLPRDSVFFHANPDKHGPFNLARRIHPQRLQRRTGVPGTCLTKLVASLRFQKPGNIFCYQAVPGFWHYGRVMAIDANVGLGEDCLLLHFYRESSMEMTKLPDFNLTDLLMRPVVCDREPWASGMFQTIDRIKLTQPEKESIGSMADKPQRIEDLQAAAKRASAAGHRDAAMLAADPEMTTSLFSQPLEIDELLCMAHDIPLSPLELE
jgi:hypothetical protein